MYQPLRKNPLWIVLALCVFALLAAYYVEYQLNLKPCALCLYQRYGFMVTAVFAILGLLQTPRLSWALLNVTAITFMITAGIAGYQILVERQIFDPPAVCRTPVFKAQSVDELRAHMQKSPPKPPCHKVIWTLFDFSMAEYNFGFCALSGLYAALMGYRTRHKRHALFKSTL